MTNPPMEWGYPRELGGFIHAFTRGQYEKTNPSDIIGHPLNFLIQLQGMGTGIVDEFNWVCTFLALIPFLFFLKMHRRERAWMIGVTAIYLCLGVLLLILLNPSTDRAARDLNKVFFTASHTLVSLLLGYGLTLIAAYMATHYQRFRSWGLIGGVVGLALAIYSFVELTQSTYFGETASYNSSSFWSLVGQTFTNPNQYGVPVFAGVILVGIVVVFLCSLLLYRNRAPLGITLLLFALLPVHSILTHWSDNEQRDHWYGYWFGHDMFTPPFKATDGKPLYPDMTKDTVLFGGTDPGRFCPTYMIFCDSLLPTNCRPVFDKKFDRRDVYIITQNALADGTYLEYIRAQFNRSAQIDQPFFRELFRFALNDKDYQTNILARMAAPLDTFFTGLGDSIEKKRRTFTSWFTEYEFTDAPAVAAKLRPSPQQDPLSKYLYENLSKETQQIVGQSADPKALGRALAKDFNVLLERELVIKKLKTEKEDEKAALDEDLATGTVSESKRQRQTELAMEIAELSKTGPLYEPDRFKGVQLSEYVTDFIKQNPQSHTRIRLNRLLLEEAYPKEIVHSIGGVYPDREIYTPSPEDSQKCFNDYLQDAQRRLQMNPPALKPGEDVHIVDNRVQVSGQVAVMAINGLLTKVIFDHNPKNEFYVEESFPLDWMYDYLTPSGIIMKINREKLPELSDEICKRDHDFWKQYSTRLCGDIIDYDTPVKKIADFIEKVYLHRDYTGFTGDRKFVRDDQAQKAFSKLRSSIGGIYQWRIDKSQNPAAQQRMIKEADFAFRQAFAYCPYSPEAVFRYVNLLLSPYMNRLDDALIIAETCLKLDPYNGQVQDLVKRLKQYRAQMPAQAPQAQAQQFAAMEKAVQDNPSNYQAIFNLAAAYMQVQQRDRALQVLERVLNDPHADAPALRTLIEVYSQIGERPKIQSAVNQFEAELKTNSGNFPAALAMADGYRQLQQPDKAVQILDQVLANPQVNSNEVLVVAKFFADMGNFSKLEASLTKLVAVAPDSPEAWYDLAALSAQLGKNQDAVSDLRRALDLSAKRHKLNPKARDLVAEAQKDNRFAGLHELPEYEKLVPSK
jgi:tetratricopeptide (TPR) repeat protein